MLNASCPSGTHGALARPATRSTEKRAFAPTSLRRPRLSDRSAARTLPVPVRLTVSTQAHSRATHLAGFERRRSPSCRSRSVLPVSSTFRGGGPLYRPLRSPLGTRDAAAIAFFVLSSSSLGRAHTSSRPTDAEGFRSCQASWVQAALVSHSQTRRRSNPGMQRTRYARR